MHRLDPELCIDCGVCEGVCPSGIISNPDKPNVAEKCGPITKKADLVVLGAGGSGLVGAVRFARLTGKKVIVVEKAKKPGGNTTLGHGFMLCYSKWHEEAGVEDTREDYIKNLCSDGRLSPELVRKATYALTDMFDWLVSFGGAEQYFKLKKMDAPLGAPANPLFGKMGAMVDFPVRAFENPNPPTTQWGTAGWGPMLSERC